MIKVSRIVNFELKKVDVVSIRSGGGGGWGEPSQRNSQLVLNDVKNRLITLKQAYEIYKVVIEPETLEINLEATKLRRRTYGNRG